MNLAQLRPLQAVLAPVAILLATALAFAAGPTLPPSLSGLRVLGPYVVLLLGTGMAVWFNRGRAFIALASLLAAYAGYSLALEFGAASFAARAVYAALAVLVPLNVLLALIFAERGVFHHFNYRWLIFGVAEILSTVWVASAGRSDLSGTVWRGLLEHWLFSSPPAPLASRLLFVAALIAAALFGVLAVAILRGGLPPAAADALPDDNVAAVAVTRHRLSSRLRPSEEPGVAPMKR